EVRSESDYGKAAEEEMAAKRADYFEAGTVVVWDVDPIAACVNVYRADAPEQPVIFRRGQVADAEPAVPGCWLLVASSWWPVPGPLRLRSRGGIRRSASGRSCNRRRARRGLSPRAAP